MADLMHKRMNKIKDGFFVFLMGSHFSFFVILIKFFNFFFKFYILSFSLVFFIHSLTFFCYFFLFFDIDFSSNLH